MATAARDRSARSRIREYLIQHGPIEDPSGGATSLLKDAVGYNGNDVAFIQLVTAMDKAAEIHREIREYLDTGPVAAIRAAQAVASSRTGAQALE